MLYITVRNESLQKEDLIPQNGDVTFIDNDNDNLYEIVYH